MKLTESKLRKIIRSVIKEETEYQAFFKKAMKKFGVKSPNDFKDDAKKKEFFSYIENT